MCNHCRGDKWPGPQLGPGEGVELSRKGPVGEEWGTAGLETGTGATSSSLPHPVAQFSHL